MSSIVKPDALSSAEVIDILKEKVGFAGKPISNIEWQYELNKTGKLVVDDQVTFYDNERAMQITIDLAIAFFIPWEPINKFKVAVNKHEYPRIELTTLCVSPTGWASIQAELPY